MVLVFFAIFSWLHSLEASLRVPQAQANELIEFPRALGNLDVVFFSCCILKLARRSPSLDSFIVSLQQ
jgi:hypothetical protein